LYAYNANIITGFDGKVDGSVMIGDDVAISLTSSLFIITKFEG